MRRALLRQLLLDHLSTTEWKRTLDLIDEIAQFRKKIGRRGWFHWIVSKCSDTWDDFLWEPSIGSTLVLMSQFEREGIVESRWKDDPPEVIEKRGGHRAREYRLTQFGHRLRNAEEAARKYKERLQSIRTRPAAAHAAAFLSS